MFSSFLCFFIFAFLLQKVAQIGCLFYAKLNYLIFTLTDLIPICKLAFILKYLEIANDILPAFLTFSKYSHSQRQLKNLRHSRRCAASIL